MLDFIGCYLTQSKTGLQYFYNCQQTSIVNVEISIKVKPLTLIQPINSDGSLSQLVLIISYTEKIKVFNIISISVINNLVFSNLFLKGLQILMQQEKTPDRLAVIRLQAAPRSQNATKLIMNKVFLNNKIVKYYLDPQSFVFQIPSTKPENALFTPFLLLKYEKKEVKSRKLHIKATNANKEIIILRVVSVLKLTTYNRDAKVNSQKFDEQILINPEQMKYVKYFLANFQNEKINLTTLKKNSGQQLQNMAGQFSYLIYRRNQQNKYESKKQANPTAITESRVYKFYKKQQLIEQYSNFHFAGIIGTSKSNIFWKSQSVYKNCIIGVNEPIVNISKQIIKFSGNITLWYFINDNYWSISRRFHRISKLPNKKAITLTIKMIYITILPIRAVFSIINY
ncbi:unnamed protein product [Paramecium octaurelia]|uniref:Transmembrane protein n=1 Tax=Paramecium octaurelia TaxID=43137 RepID=A0A8S1X6Q2_PAROT|nr:unnamed protein product [Paramecium octaurelia]